MKTPSYEIELNKSFLPKFMLEDLSVRGRTRLDLLPRDEHYEDEMLDLPRIVTERYRVISFLPLGKGSPNESYPSYYGLLVEHSFYHKFDNGDEKTESEIQSQWVDIRFLPIVSPGLIIERRYTKLRRYINKHRYYGISYDDRHEITFDTADVTYGTWEDLGLLEQLTTEVPEEYIEMSKAGYCAVVKPKGTSTTYIFPALVIGAATYFNHQFLAKAALNGDLRLFKELFDRRYARRMPKEWFKFAKEKYDYVIPDRFYKEDAFANREFHAIFKRIRTERGKKGFWKEKTPGTNILIRFPFAPGSEHTFTVHGIPAGEGHFIVHEITEYGIPGYGRVYTGAISLKHRSEYVENLWKKDREFQRSQEGRAKRKAEEDAKKMRERMKQEAEMKKKGYGKFDF